MAIFDPAIFDEAIFDAGAVAPAPVVVTGGHRRQTAAPRPERISMRAVITLGRLSVTAQVRADENRDWLI